MTQPSLASPQPWSSASAEAVCINGIGARTPLGLDAPSSAAAVRCSVSALSEHPLFVDKLSEPMTITADAELAPDLGVGPRIVQLVLSAIGEAVGESGPPLAHARLLCWVGLPSDRPGIPPDLQQSVSAHVVEEFGFSPAAVQTLPHGHAAGLMAMQLAAAAISAGQADACVVAGADSYLDNRTLEWLDENGWLMSDQNRNGFPPGEAAGACMLTNKGLAERLKRPVLATMIAAQTAVEPHPIRNREVCVGVGLTEALRGVAGGLPPDQLITGTYCDLNGERYRSSELAYAVMRTQKQFVDALEYECPADCWGDVGAASGPLFAILAIQSSQRGYAGGELPLLWAGSECGYRTAVLLRLLPPRRIPK